MPTRPPVAGASADGPNTEQGFVPSVPHNRLEVVARLLGPAGAARASPSCLDQYDQVMRAAGGVFSGTLEGA